MVSDTLDSPHSFPQPPSSCPHLILSRLLPNWLPRFTPTADGSPEWQATGVGKRSEKPEHPKSMRRAQRVFSRRTSEALTPYGSMSQPECNLASSITPCSSGPSVPYSPKNQPTRRTSCTRQPKTNPISCPHKRGPRNQKFKRTAGSGLKAEMRATKIYKVPYTAGGHRAPSE